MCQKLKETKFEKKNLITVHIIKHKELSTHIAELENDILELKSTKADLMRQIDCKTAAKVQAVRKAQKQNVQTLEKLTAQNSELNRTIADNKSKFIEIRDGITPENTTAVQEERYNIRNEYELRIIEKLRNTYCKNYSYDRFRQAAADVAKALGEKARSIREQFRHDRQQSEQQLHKDKQHELEG